MMTNAPTDNLYKFVTFLGIALLVFCTWSLGDNLRKMEEAVVEAEVQSKSLTTDVSSLSNSLETQKTELAGVYDKVITADQRNEPFNSVEKAKVNSQIYAIESRNEIMTTELKDIFDRQRNLQLIVGRSRVITESLQIQNKFWYSGIVLGGLMTLIGFLSWYFLHQRYQDMLAKRSVEEVS